MRQVDMLEKYKKFAEDLEMEIMYCNDVLKKAKLQGMINILEMVIDDINEPVEHPIF